MLEVIIGIFMLLLTPSLTIKVALVLLEALISLQRQVFLVSGYMRL